MKFLLIILLTGLSFGATTGELDAIKLVIPLEYGNFTEPSIKGFVKEIVGTNASKVKIYAADKYYDHSGLVQKVSSYLAESKKELLPYFPKNNELDIFVDSIIQAGIKEYFATNSTDKNKIKITDEGMILFYKFLGNKLIGKFADRILEKKGLTDQERRNLWATKILEPFNTCINFSQNSQYQANHCLEALKTSFTPSIGLALVYELSRDNLNSALPETERAAFNLQQIENYTKCLPQRDLTSADIETCALSSMKNGVSKVTDTALMMKIIEKSSSKEKANEIKKIIWGSFEGCLSNIKAEANKNVDYTAKINNCIDDLVQNSGAEVVIDKISTNTTIASILPPEQVKIISVEKSNEFRKCAAGQKIKGARKNGVLDISVCENAITNDITKKVVEDTFKLKAQSVIKNDKNLAEQLGQEGKDLLAQCWNPAQSALLREGCLRKTVISFSQKIAAVKLDLSIPAEMPEKADIANSSVEDLVKCMNRDLPKNISESRDLNPKIDACTGKLTLKVALSVADHQIRSIAESNLSKKETDNMVRELVEEDFAECLGALPSDKTLEKCSDDLTVKAAMKISETSFEKQVYAYIEKAGGASALDTSNSQIKAFLSALIKANTQCIATPATSPVIDYVNTCIKASIKKIAFFFGELEFNKKAGSMYIGREADKKTVESNFKKSLNTCLSSKEGNKFSINDYTSNLYICAQKVSSATTLTVAQDQIVTSVDNHLKDSPGINLSEKRKVVKTTLLKGFQNCLSIQASQDKCIDELKRDATKSIVVEYSHSEIKNQINADVTPKELKPSEEKFLTCVNSPLHGDALSIAIDKCVKNFTLSFAKELGALKLHYLLKQALGSDDYNAKKLEIDNSIDQYNECLEDLKKYDINTGLTDKLAFCTDGLTSRGISLVRNSINNWMTTEQKDAATVMIKHEFANFLPCLSGLLPTSPYNQNLQNNVDSSVKPLAVLLSHYIEYNPENAQQALEVVIEKLSVDLNDVVQTKQAKVELLDFLCQSGTLDQFIKSVVRGTVQDSLEGISLTEVPQSLRDLLLQKKNYEEIFNSPEGSQIKVLVMEKLLKPALLNNEDMRGLPFKTNTNAIKENIVKLLIDAPSFGQQAMRMGIQNQINSVSGIKKFFAKALYGGESLQWEKVRLTKRGEEAENFIRDSILLPKFMGTPQPKDEAKAAYAEAEKLVIKAIKKYENN